MAKTRIQNINLPNVTHTLPITKTVVQSDGRGVIECDNRDADLLLQTPGWAREGEAPRQPARSVSHEIVQPPEPHEIGGGGLIGHANRGADRILASLSEEEREKLATAFDERLAQAKREGEAERSALEAKAAELQALLDAATAPKPDPVVDPVVDVAPTSPEAPKIDETPAPSAPAPSAPPALAADATRADVIAFADSNNIKVPSRVRSASVPELRAYVDAAHAEALSKAASGETK
jgi:hypothetical protein